jgi:hypothetical protein
MPSLFVFNNMSSSLKLLGLEPYLDSMRLMGDPPADQIIQVFFASEKGKKDLMQWLSGIKHNSDIANTLTKLEPGIQVEIQEMIQIPHWADPEKLNKARKFFTRNSPWVMNLLGLLSLPFCYAAADGARVLCFTERLSKDPETRLRETAEFIWEIMDPQAFEPQSKALASILKVRFIHSAIRYYILKDPAWNSAWGLPINQEDMAGTNLAFSLVILRGLRKVGIRVSEEEKDAFLHLWNLVGYLMGLEPRLIPDRVQDTIHLEKTIRTRHFKSSEHGKKLTRDLVDFFNSIPKEKDKPEVVLQNWMVELVSEPIASLIDLKSIPRKGIPLQWIRVLNQLGLLDKEASKASYESRYKTYLTQNSRVHSAPIAIVDYSLFPLPSQLQFPL